MVWRVEYTDEFGEWWKTLALGTQEDISASVELLVELGPGLPYPHCSGIQGSRYDHMRELRGQSGGKPIRVFYAFDPRRAAILLIGSDKTDNRRFVPLADRLYDEHLGELRKEGAI